MIIQTDAQGRTWRLLERDDGSISLYYTRPSTDAHFVVWDSLDENDILALKLENGSLRSRLAEGEEIVAEAVTIHDRLKAENEALQAALAAVIAIAERRAQTWDETITTADAKALLGDTRPSVGAILERYNI